MNNRPKPLHASEIAKVVQQARDEFLMRLELHAVVAAEKKSAYDAYITAGFTPEQALLLVK